MDIALDIQLHLQSAVPVLEGEHGAPVQPEVAAEHLIVEEVADALVLQLLVGGEEQLHDLHGALVGDVELTVGMGVLATVHRGPAQGVIGVGLVEPVVLVQHADTLRLNGGDGVEQIPHDLEVVVHLTAAPHDIADVLELPAVAGAAGSGALLQNVDPLALHLAVTHQIAGGSQRSQTAAHDVGGFIVHALRLFGTGKGLIVTTGIIHRNALLSVDRCAARPLLSTHTGGRRRLAGMFSSDDENIHLGRNLFNKQKNPGDKFFITGMGGVQFFIIPLRLMQACPSASVAGRPPHCRGAPAPVSAPSPVGRPSCPL